MNSNSSIVSGSSSSTPRISGDPAQAQAQDQSRPPEVAERGFHDLPNELKIEIFKAVVPQKYVPGKAGLGGFIDTLKLTCREGAGWAGLLIRAMPATSAAAYSGKLLKRFGKAGAKSLDCFLQIAPNIVVTSLSEDHKNRFLDNTFSDFPFRSICMDWYFGGGKNADEVTKAIAFLGRHAQHPKRPPLEVGLLDPKDFDFSPLAEALRSYGNGHMTVNMWFDDPKVESVLVPAMQSGVLSALELAFDTEKSYENASMAPLVKALPHCRQLQSLDLKMSITTPDLQPVLDDLMQAVKSLPLQTLKLKFCKGDAGQFPDFVKALKAAPPQLTSVRLVFSKADKDWIKALDAQLQALAKERPGSRFRAVWEH